MAAYYNEFDPYAAQWLRNLIKNGQIAPGDVDERSIVDVRADDLRGYVQCHFFAGIGGWSLALRLAGWPDDRPVWTGSCPCQPFSAAGKQRGSDDERHLWPAFFRLIRECRPATVFGEQVAGAAGLAWLDHVCADLEGAGYAAAAADLPACSVGAPHRRQRLWWAAHSADLRPRAAENRGSVGAQQGQGRVLEPARACNANRMADADGGLASDRDIQRGGEHGLLAQGGGVGRMADANGEREGQERGVWRGAHAESARSDGRMADADRNGRSAQSEMGDKSSRGELRESSSNSSISGGMEHAECIGQPRPWQVGRPGNPAAGSSRQTDWADDASHLDMWRDLEWLACSDGKARPTKPGLFPLAHGVPARVGRLRAYGNAIVPQVAAEFIMACDGR